MSGENDNIREQLSAYLDGELSQAEARRVEAELESDAELQAELDELRRLRDLVGSLPSSRAPEGFVERVMSRAERNRLMAGAEPQSGRGGPLRWARLLATAAVLLVAAGAGLVLISSLVFTSTRQDSGEPAKVGEIARERASDGEMPERSEKRQPEDETVTRDESLGEAGGRPATDLPEEAPARESAEPRAAAKPESSSGTGAEELATGGDRYLYRRPRVDAAARPPADDLEQRAASQGRSVDLYVSDLVEANEKVIDVLNSRGIVVEPPEGNGRASEAQWARNYSRSRAAFANNLADEQVQIVAFVPTDEVSELLSELQQATSEQNGENLKLRIRRTASAPAETDRDGVRLAGRQTSETGEREDLLRRQLDRQTAVRAAGGDTTTTAEMDAYYDRPEGDLAETLPTSRGLAAADVEPVLINLLDFRVIPEELREDLEKTEDGGEDPQSQPSSED